MGKIGKGITCSISDCSEIAIRSISNEKLDSARLKISGARRSYLCKRHYKEFKKKRRETRRIDKWRWSV
ncbi:MAG: hypothetical protein JSV20_09140 [Candidatus Bathyarchaeota archaeon]|nr:MAG: hypothetical protein JSV20_09140 [Candidatus Bathyarchaeota archaeon]